MTGSMLLAAILAYGQRQVIGTAVVVIWFAMIVLISLGRAFMLYFYRHSPVTDGAAIDRRLFKFRFFVLLSGLLWGSAGFLMFPQAHQEHQMLLAVIIVGLTSGAVASLSADLFCSVVFPVTALVPLMLRLLVHGDDFTIPIGMAIVLYILFMVANARRIHQNAYQNIMMRIEATAREDALRASEEQLRLVLEGAELGFWDWNIITGEVERNERWAKMLGYSYDEIKHTTQQWADFIHPDDRQIARQSIYDVIEGRSASHKLEYRMLHKNGGFRWILDQANVMQRDAEGKPTRMSGTHSDITERKQLELALKQQAHHDYLTGASNRGHFMELAEHELSRAIRYGNPLSLMMLDIDFFKQVNDTHGHKTGDAVLRKLIEVCRQTLREVDVIGRMGGEEFAILLPETDIEASVEAAERLREVIANTKVPLDSGLPLQFTVSIGVTALASQDDNMDVLLNLADKALYEAKGSGRNKVCRSKP